MMSTPRPGRWLLKATVPSDDVGQSIVGDLVEEHAIRAESEGAARAWIWFNRQAVGVAWRQVVKGVGGSWDETRRGVVMQDMRFAWRALRAHPGVHTMVVTVIAVGVAGTALAFSMVDQALLRALPYPAPQELYVFRHLSLEAGSDAGQLSPMDVQDLRESLAWERTLSSYLFDPTSSLATLTGNGPPMGVATAFVDEAFFGVLGTQAGLGRTLGVGDNVPGRDAVVVISHDFWTQHLGADPDVLGQNLRLDDGLLEVVGVMPPSFQFPSPEAQVWMPASLVTEDMVPNARGVRYRQGIVRVPAPGTVGEARVAAEGVFARLAEAYPDSNEGWTRVELVPLRESLVGGFRMGLLFLMGVTGLLLMVVAASVGGLLTARAASRTREMAIRLSIGADRKRLTRQLLGESLLLATAGGALGLALATLASGAVSRFTSETLGFAATVTPDLRVAAFTALVSLSTGLLLGLIPAWTVLRAPPNAFLGGARQGVGGARRGLRTLVLAETALATVLLAGTGLMTRSFVALIDTDPGFDTEDVWSLRLRIPVGSDPTQLARDRQRLMDIATDVPGVLSVGGSKTSLLEGGGESYTFLAQGPSGEPVEVTPESGTYLVLPGFFETLGARFVAGRPFTDDDPGLTVVLNRTLAENLWPGEDPLTKQLMLGESEWPVLGVIESLHDDGLDAGSLSAVYVDAARFPRSSLFMFLRIAPGADGVIPSVQQAIWAEYPDQVILETRAVSSLIDEAVAGPRWLARVIGIFAALAIVLAALGVYGVVSQAVTSRRGEIAVRIALGASPDRVLREHLRSGLLMIGMGTAIGLIVALGLGQAISSLLFGVAPTDLVAFGGAGAVVLGFGFVASLVPALRATRIDPVHIIREE